MGQRSSFHRFLPAAAAFHKAILLLVGVLALALAGCRAELATKYGQRKGPEANSSVNGTAALGEMFEHQGHTVYSWSSLSPRLQKRAEVIVWFPDDFQPPKQEVRRWLEDWLKNAPGRTLIYVGRDFDAASWYWEAIEPQVPASQSGELRIRRANAKLEFGARRRTKPGSADCPWFTLAPKVEARPVESLEGDPAWLEGIDPSQAALQLHSRLTPPDEADVLLRSEEDVLVSRQTLGESQLLVVANGSFLLNAMLVNRENRKLAQHLIDEVGPPSKTVVFLESGASGPPIRQDDRLPQVPTGMEIFHIWPTNWILLHLALVGILFCFARYPIFGRPHEPQPEARSDFGQHLQALGELLERSGDTSYAYAKLLHYRQMISDSSPRKPEPPKTVVSE